MMMMIVATAVDLLGDEIFHFFVFYKYHFDNKKGVKYEKCVHVVRCGHKIEEIGLFVLFL